MRKIVILIGALLISSCGSNPPGQKHEPPAVRAQPAQRHDPDDRPVIAAFGDSLTAGLGVDPAQNFPARLQTKLDAAGYRYRIVNLGVSGDTSSQGLNRLDAVLDLRPAIVILALGANDGLRGLPIETIRSNLATIITSLQREGIDVLLAGIQIPPNYGPRYTGAFREIFPELAGRYHLALVPFLLEGVAGIPELNQDDGIHPNGQGYEIISDNVLRALEPLLSK